MASSDTHQLIWRFYFVTGKLHSGILTEKRKENSYRDLKTYSSVNAVNINNRITCKKWYNQNKPKQTTNKPLVWKTDCGWPFLRDLFRHRWPSLPVFPSELTGSVQRPYLLRYFRCLRARLEIWSGGNGHEPQPAHRAAVVLQIPNKQKWWTVFRGCWNTVSSSCVSSF